MASFHFGWLVLTWTIIGHPDYIQGQSAVITGPVIGILTHQEVDSDLISVPTGAISFHLISYVKWLQTQNATIVPIRINQTDSYYTTIFNSINGLVIPGGSASIRSSGYSKAGSILYNLAITANSNGDFFPIWGTCLGFQRGVHH